MGQVRLRPTTSDTVAVNQMIAALARGVQRRILESCTLVPVAFGDQLCVAGERQRYAYFPVDGCISLVTSTGNHTALEVAMIGNEGMLGATLVLGVDAAPLTGVVQGAGNLWRLTGAQFQKQVAASPSLARVVNNYLYVYMAQQSRTIACSRFHLTTPRLARWLLMCDDRSHGLPLTLTHAYLADMLGVQRSAVTIAAGNFQRSNLIQYSRGVLTILNRAGLEAASCTCYPADAGAYLFARSQNLH